MELKTCAGDLTGSGTRGRRTLNRLSHTARMFILLHSSSLAIRYPLNITLVGPSAVSPDLPSSYVRTGGDTLFPPALAHRPSQMLLPLRRKREAGSLAGRGRTVFRQTGLRGRWGKWASWGHRAEGPPEPAQSREDRAQMGRRLAVRGGPARPAAGCWIQTLLQEHRHFLACGALGTPVRARGATP